MVVTNRSFDSR